MDRLCGPCTDIRALGPTGRVLAHSGPERFVVVGPEWNVTNTGLPAVTLDMPSYGFIEQLPTVDSTALPTGGHRPLDETEGLTTRTSPAILEKSICTVQVGSREFRSARPRTPLRVA